MTETAVTHVDELRFALDRNFDPTAGAPRGSRCHTHPPLKPAQWPVADHLDRKSLPDTVPDAVLALVGFA